MATGVSFQGFLFVLVLAVPVVISQDGTVPHIEELFLGRCYDFQHTVIKHSNSLRWGNADCADLKTKFFQAFVNKSECGVQEKDFQEFIDAARQDIPASKAMFWSGTNYLAHRFSNKGKRRVTLEDTLIGYLADGLQFCGQVSPPGINYTRCPDWYECTNSARDAFWRIASETFARGATGEVMLLLDGSNLRKAYKRDSFFGAHELPILTPPRVTKLHVLLSHQLGKPRLETCGTGSLLELREDVEAKGLRFLCQDDPESVMFLLCSEDPYNDDCMSLLGNSASMAVFSYPVTGLLPLVVMTWYIRYFQN